MKKVTLALTVLLSLGLAACSNHKKDDNSYEGEILFSQNEGNNVRLTIRQNDCNSQKEGPVKDVILIEPYNSNHVVGACVRVTKDENGNLNVKNISRSESRLWISRSGKDE